MLENISLFALSIICVLLALLLSGRRKARLIMWTAALAVSVLTVASYYSTALTGRGLTVLAGCLVLPGAPSCAETTFSPSSNVAGQNSNVVYRTPAPTEMSVGDRWGQFEIDGQCNLRFGNEIVHALGYVDGGCEFTPTFSPSPSGRIVLVLFPIGYEGQHSFAIVHTESGQLVRDSRDPFYASGLISTGAWSIDEHHTLLGVFVPGGLIEQPCIFDVTTQQLQCTDESRFYAMVERPVLNSDFGHCLRQDGRQNACALAITLGEATWQSSSRSFDVALTLEIYRGNPQFGSVDQSQENRLFARDGALTVMIDGRVRDFRVLAD